MKDVSIQTQAELLENLNKFHQAHTKGRDPDKDFIYENYVSRILTEIQRRG